MAELGRPWRTAFGWAVTLALLIFALSDWGDADEPKAHATHEEDDGGGQLRITSISDGEVNPGDAVVVSFAGAAPSPPLEARLAKRPAEIIEREPSAVVVRIPEDAPPGKAALRLGQGSQRSKAWDLHVRATNYRKLVARLVGGLALFVLGLGLLALGIRGLAGNRLRALLGRLTVSPPRAVGVGALVGAATQLTSSAAAFTVSLVEARVLAVGPAVAVLVGAQFGASLSGALLPVQLARESLLLIATGVLWTRIGQSRRGRVLANVVLGTGLMLYGLHLLQTSVEPLVSDPKILPYLGYLRSADVASTLACAATGVVLAFVLQGVGPVYVLVVGLAQTTTLPLANALAILAGTNLGAAFGMAVIAWQAGPTTRPLARSHLLFGATAAAFVVATLPVWTRLAAVVVGGGDDLAYGHSVLRTHIAPQLALGFAAAQLAVIAIWLGVLPMLVGRVTRARTRAVAPPEETTPHAIDRELVEVLERLRRALAFALEMSRAGERTSSAECEAALADARRRLEARYKAITAEQASSDIERGARSLVAAMQLQRAVEQAVHVAELGVERGVRLTDEAKHQLAAMHAIAHESFEALLAALADGNLPDLEDAGAREIRMNALEAAGRKVAVAHRKRSTTTSSLQIGIAELIDSYENVGNHLFRLAKALAEDSDEI